MLLIWHFRSVRHLSYPWFNTDDKFLKLPLVYPKNESILIVFFRPLTWYYYDYEDLKMNFAFFALYSCERISFFLICKKQTIDFMQHMRLKNFTIYDEYRVKSLCRKQLCNSRRIIEILSCTLFENYLRKEFEVPGFTWKH